MCVYITTLTEEPPKTSVRRKENISKDYYKIWVIKVA